MPAPTSVLPSEFSEDEFQAFAFAELARRFRAVVIGGPYIEDRRAERRHGVDAWITIRSAGKVRPLFFQFKRPQLVISAKLDAGCAALYDDQPYFRFGLRRDNKDVKSGAPDVHRQHNNLVALRTHTGYDAYYCAPGFIQFSRLIRAMYRGEIYETCLLGDALCIGFVPGRESHHIAYATDLTAWSFHSEPRSLGRPTSWDKVLGDGEVKDWTAQSLDELADEIAQAVAQERSEDIDDPGSDPSGMPGASPADRKGVASVLRLARVAFDAYGGPVVFVPAPDPSK